MDHRGVPSCVSADDYSWQPCDLAAQPRAPTDQQGQLLVANRTTVRGEACRLPAVQRCGGGGHCWAAGQCGPDQLGLSTACDSPSSSAGTSRNGRYFCMIHLASPPAS